MYTSPAFGLRLARVTECGFADHWQWLVDSYWMKGSICIRDSCDVVESSYKLHEAGQLSLQTSSWYN
jgi:hypothetical protein